MAYESIEEWKEAIKAVFKAEAGCSDSFCQTQADAFEEIHEGENLADLPTPEECYEEELSQWAANC